MEKIVDFETLFSNSSLEIFIIWSAILLLFIKQVTALELGGYKKLILSLFQNAE